MFQRLQWKLTAYYTCFTSLLGMIAVISLLALIWALVSSTLATQLVSTFVLDPIAEQIQPLLGTEDETAEIGDFLNTIVNEGSWTIETGGGPLDVEIDSIVSLEVVGSDRQIVAAFDEERIGQSYSELADVELNRVLERIFTDSGFLGNAVVRNISSSITETVFFAIEEDRATQGVIVVTYENPLAEPGLFAGLASVLLIPLMLPVLCIAGIVGTFFGLVVARGLSVRLGKLATSAETWSKGDFSVTVSDKSKDEIGQLGRQLNGMASELEVLMQSRGQLAMIEERNRIARDLHDSAKQQIFATTMQLSTAKVLMDIDPDKAKAHIAEAEQLAKTVQKELSGLIEELRPAQLEGQGLFAAVRSSAETLTRQYNIPVDVRVTGERELPLNVEQPMFRILQEAFNNIVKHSQATQVDINLNVTNNAATLIIHDNGVGFDQSDARTGGIGLRSMQERIEQMSGKLVVKSGPNVGTTITVSAPLALPESIVASGNRPDNST